MPGRPSAALESTRGAKGGRNDSDRDAAERSCRAPMAQTGLAAPAQRCGGICPDRVGRVRRGAAGPAVAGVGFAQRGGWFFFLRPINYLQAIFDKLL